VSDPVTQHPPSEDLRAYGRGLLPIAEAAALEQHIAACNSCCRVLEDASADEFLNRLRAVQVTTNAPEPAVGVPVSAGEHPRFRIEREIGRGGMGVVYLARQVPLNRLVALKMMLGGERAGPKELIRFLAEAEAAAAVRHAHVVQVHEYGDHVGRPYLAMEYLPGGTLSERLKAEGALDPRRSAELVQKLAGAVQAAHDQGIVHRDLKPSNILYDAEGEPRVTDFGLAKRDTADLTRTEMIIGTPAYMAPEQTQGRGKFATPETDVWALGVILYECLTGVRPFDSHDSHAVVKQIAEHDPPPPRHPSHRVPRDLATICLKCLRKVPDKRYRTAQALADDLGAFLAGRSISARRPSLGERTARWSRRHPRLSTGLTVGLTALLLLVGPATVIAVRSNQLAARRQELAQSEAVLTHEKAVRELKAAQIELAMQSLNPAFAAQGSARAQGLLSQYGVGTDPRWAERASMHLLSAGQQRVLRQEFGSVLMMIAGAELKQRPAGDLTAAAAALKWNRLAEECLPPDCRPRILVSQREQLVKLLPTSAPLIDDSAATEDAFYDAYELSLNGKPAVALEMLTAYTEDHLGHALAWVVRGMCHEAVGQFGEAVTAYTVLIVQWPDLPSIYYARGSVRQRQGYLKLAEADFTRALDRKPDWAEALFARSIVRTDRKDYAGAEADLTAALGQPNCSPRVYFERSRVRKAMGNRAGAEADLAEGRRREPTEVLGWITRGRSKMGSDPTGALADFDAALRLEPRASIAQLNKAIVLADQLNRPSDAVAVLDALLDRYPHDAESRMARAVYLARVGDAKRAKEDLAIVLKEEPTISRLYQAACVYSLLSKTDPTGATRQEALQYMAKAFRGGFVQFDLIDKDSDFDPLRDDPEFKEMVQHAKTTYQTNLGNSNSATKKR
jgi:eukaryotic-like serine/threonine-protein kinase